MKRIGFWGMMATLALLLAACGTQTDQEFQSLSKGSQGNLRINVLLNTDATDEVLERLSEFGTVQGVIEPIDAVSMVAMRNQLDDIQQLPFVDAANPDAERNGIPIDTVEAPDFSGGASSWNLDSVDVTDAGSSRVVDFDGDGAYVAVLDTGLLDSWRRYFPEERIAEEYAISFGGGGGEVGVISEQPNKWEHDVNSHGTHVTSTIIGFALGDAAVNGVAPKSQIIPVKVLNQNGSGWSSVVAAGISYIADLKSGPLSDRPVIINMSLGGPVLDSVEQAALDYAIEAGVIVVASAGNSGAGGMGYPGAYPPVISVAASGWTGLATNGWMADVPDPTSVDDFYIAPFSSRELAEEGQQLDVTAPGAAVVGPYQLNSGNTLSYYYLSGTSMASPHVAGIAALMAQQDPGLTQAQAEGTLVGTALPFEFESGETCREDFATLAGSVEELCWGPDATGAGLVSAALALNGTSSDTSEPESESGSGNNGKGGKPGGR